jgi:hypothetical protein
LPRAQPSRRSRFTADMSAFHAGPRRRRSAFVGELREAALAAALLVGIEGAEPDRLAASAAGSRAAAGPSRVRLRRERRRIGPRRPT